MYFFSSIWNISIFPFSCAKMKKERKKTVNLMKVITNINKSIKIYLLPIENHVNAGCTYALFIRNI